MKIVINLILLMCVVLAGKPVKRKYDGVDLKFSHSTKFCNFTYYDHDYIAQNNIKSHYSINNLSDVHDIDQSDSIFGFLDSTTISNDTKTLNETLNNFELIQMSPDELDNVLEDRVELLPQKTNNSKQRPIDNISNNNTANIGETCKSNENAFSGECNVNLCLLTNKKIDKFDTITYAQEDINVVLNLDNSSIIKAKPSLEIGEHETSYIDLPKVTEINYDKETNILDESIKGIRCYVERFIRAKISYSYKTWYSSRLENIQKTFEMFRINRLYQIEYETFFTPVHNQQLFIKLQEVYLDFDKNSKFNRAAFDQFFKKFNFELFEFDITKYYQSKLYNLTVLQKNFFSLKS